MGTQRTSFGWTRGVCRARSTPRWGQVAGCWKSDSELGWRRSELERCGQMLSHKEKKQQKDPLHTTNSKEKARRNKEEGFCNSVHRGKKEAMKQLGSRGSNNIFKRITWGKPGLPCSQYKPANVPSYHLCWHVFRSTQLSQIFPKWCTPSKFTPILSYLTICTLALKLSETNL